VQLEPGGEATVYTETVVHAAPEQFASEAPYQIAIVELADGQRLTVRIAVNPEGGRVHIGDRVVFTEIREGIPYYASLPAIT